MLESLEDRCLLSTFTVLNTTDGGAGSLRQAIVDANATANAGGLPDRIEFNIPGPDTVVKTINVGTTALPVITDPVVIDGYTQPGSRENTNTVESRLGLSTVLRIELKGAGSDVHFGLNIQAGNSTVQGLVINGFVSCGILLSPNGGNVIEGNFIGTDAGGSVRRGPGVGVSITSSGNTIGGTTPAARNLISGHASNAVTIDAINAAVNNVVQGNLIGIDVTGTLTLRNGGGVVIARPLASGNRIGGTEVGAGNVISGNGSAVAIGNAGPGNLVQGNFIGTDVTGTLALPNGGAGGSPAVSVSNSPGTVIGGDDADDGLLDGIVRARNVISGNAATGFFGVGAVTFFDSLGSRVQGNFIGTDVTGAAPLGNGEAGIGIRGSVGTMIGGTTSGAGNVIAFNGSNGVVHVLTGGGNTGHAILGNSIFSNGGLGIDLGNLMGVTPNDPGDADTGPNNLQNFPVLNGATSTTTATTIRGTLNSKPFGIYLLQFFASDNADPSGHGEGQTFLGQTTVTTDNNGDARDVAGNLGFTAVLLGVTVPPTRFFTATATDVALFDHDGNPFTPEVVRNDTSEFSRSINAGVFQLNGPAYFGGEWRRRADHCPARTRQFRSGVRGFHYQQRHRPGWQRLHHGHPNTRLRRRRNQ